MVEIKFVRPPRLQPLRKGRKTRKIFCDESSQNGSKYFVLGALFYDVDQEEMEATLESVKLKYMLKGEIKWDKVPRKPGKYFDGYKALLDTFVRLPIEFKAIIIDTEKYPLDHPVHFGGDHELGYYKFYYQLLYNGVIVLDPKLNFQVRLDYRPKADDDRIVELSACIDAQARKHGFPDIEGFRCCSIEERNSKALHSLQLADLLAGIVAARWNQKTKNPTRLELIRYLENLLKIDISTSSFRSERKFNRWVFEARAKE